MRSVHDYADPVACVLFSFRPLRLELAHRNPKLRHSRHDAVVADSTSQHRWEAHDLPPQKPGRNKQVNAVNGGYIVFDVLSILVKIGNMTEHVWSYMIYVFTFLFVSVLQCVFVVQCFSICRTNTNQTKSTFRYRFTHQHLLPIASQEKTPRSWSWMEPCRFRDKCDMSPPIWQLKLVAGSCVDLQMIFWYVVPCFPGKYGIIHDNTTNIIQYKCLMSWNFWVGHDLFLGYIFRHHQKWVCSWDHLWRKS